MLFPSALTTQAPLWVGEWGPDEPLQDAQEETVRGEKWFFIIFWILCHSDWLSDDSFFSLQTQEVEKDHNGGSSRVTTDMVSVATQTKTGRQPWTEFSWAVHREMHTIGWCCYTLTCLWLVWATGFVSCPSFRQSTEKGDPSSRTVLQPQFESRSKRGGEAHIGGRVSAHPLCAVWTARHWQDHDPHRGHSTGASLVVWMLKMQRIIIYCKHIYLQYKYNFGIFVSWVVLLWTRMPN